MSKLVGINEFAISLTFKLNNICYVCSGCKKVYHNHIKLPRWMSGCGIW